MQDYVEINKKKKKEDIELEGSSIEYRKMKRGNENFLMMNNWNFKH